MVQEDVDEENAIVASADATFLLRIMAVYELVWSVRCNTVWWDARKLFVTRVELFEM